MKTIQLIFLALMLFFGTSCSERYDIELDDTFTRLVVDGLVTSDTLRHGVRLTTSTSYFFNEAPPAVSGAAVYLEDGVQRRRLVEVEGDPGFYRTEEAFAGQPGQNYQLEITLAEPIGEAVRFTAENRMPETEGRIDSIVLEYRADFDFYLLNLFAVDPPTVDFYKFDAFINGRILTDTASRSLVVDDKFFNGNNTNGLAVMFLRGDEIKAGDTVTLQLSAITEDYYRFFMELSTESGPSNPLFSGPPANIRSNVKTGALGYFAATRLARATIIVQPNPKGF